MKRPKGRFRVGLDPGALGYSSSLPVDRRLYAEDIEGSLAHVAMLSRQGIIPRVDARRIARGLKRVKGEIASGKLTLGAGGRDRHRLAGDDVHMVIEQRLTEIIGPVAGRLHTARSRNDQVALDMRLFLRSTIRMIIAAIDTMQASLIASARRHRAIIMPGYTHLQRAQPILLAHHLIAYVEMLERDRGRFLGCALRVNHSPLGAAALAGTTFPIDRRQVAKALGFTSPIANSVDAVSDRDAHLEFLAAAAITMMHCSRLAEELVLWSSQEWGFVRIGERYTTGSSIMPQKRNPDIAELMRGKTGRVYGDLVALLTVMKGLPLAYNRDMQEDKEPVFDAADTLLSTLRVGAGMIRSARFSGRRFESELDGGALLATELADYLTRKGMAFRMAHTVVGDIVSECERTRKKLTDLSLGEYRTFSPLFGKDVASILSARAAITRRVSAGSTSPRAVSAALRKWTSRLNGRSRARRSP